MCLNCGCGEPEKRHNPSDITQDDLQRAAEGGDMSLEEAVANIQASLAGMAGTKQEQSATQARPDSVRGA